MLSVVILIGGILWRNINRRNYVNESINRQMQILEIYRKREEGGWSENQLKEMQIELNKLEDEFKVFEEIYNK